MTLRNIAAFVVALVAVLPGRSATADERRVAVVPFQGEEGARAESEIYEALNARFFLIAPNKIAKGIREIGGLRESARGTYVAFAKKVHADVIVSGSLARDTKWRLRVAVRDGQTGTLLAMTGWTGQRLKDVSATITGAATSWLVAQLGKTGKTGKTESTGSAGPAETLATTSAPSPRPTPRRAPAAADPDKETEDSEEAADADTDAEPSPRSASSRRSAESGDDDPPAGLVKRRFATRTPTFELAVGPRVFSRSFTYTDNLAGLPGYTIVGAPGAEVDLEIYPLARVDTGIRNLGFAGNYETAHSARTQAPSGAATSYETKISAYRAGIRYSIPLSRLLFVLGADYGQHRFALVGGPDQSPNVGYRFVRPSATFRLDVVSALAVGLTVGYSNVTAVEGLGDASRFHRLTAVGVDARAMVGYFFSTGIELKLVGDVRYYAHSMNVQPGDPIPVGGAIDAHVGASLLLGYLLR